MRDLFPSKLASNFFGGECCQVLEEFVISHVLSTICECQFYEVWRNIEIEANVRGKREWGVEKLPQNLSF